MLVRTRGRHAEKVLVVPFLAWERPGGGGGECDYREQVPFQGSVHSVGSGGPHFLN